MFFGIPLDKLRCYIFHLFVGVGSLYVLCFTEATYYFSLDIFREKSDLVFVKNEYLHLRGIGNYAQLGRQDDNLASCRFFLTLRRN